MIAFLYQRSVITALRLAAIDPPQRTCIEACCSRRGNSDALCFV